MPVDSKLVEILVCPKCKGDLDHQHNGDEGFACRACNLYYAVEDGIPNFVIEAAAPLGSATASSGDE